MFMDVLRLFAFLLKVLNTFLENLYVFTWPFLVWGWILRPPLEQLQPKSQNHIHNNTNLYMCKVVLKPGLVFISLLIVHFVVNARTRVHD